MPTLITSLQNARIKNVIKLNNRRQRDARQVMPLEGAREIGRALQNGFVPAEAYLCRELAITPEAVVVAEHLHELGQKGQCPLFTVSKEVFARMAYRGDKDGLLVLLPYWQRPLNRLTLSKNPLLIVVEGGEKPGNLGAILRTADAAGVEAMIICDPLDRKGTDIFNPNVVRASLGTLFTVPVTAAHTAELIQWLREQNIQMAAMTPEGEFVYTSVDLRGPTAVIMGSEAHGLSQTWLEAASLHLKIPMFGQIDSLNLSVSAALILYEVVRQRGMGTHPI